jgi:hypothetical protein
MNPINNHELGQARHRELEAEFAPYGPHPFNRTGSRAGFRFNRLVAGLGSILLGLTVLVQMLAA